MGSVAFPPASQALATAIIAPVMMGDCFQLMIFGFVLSTFISHTLQPSWARSSILLKCVIWAVLLLNMGISGIDLYDIWYYSTIQERNILIVIGGTLPTCLKPALVGLIGTAVQSVLVVRTSKAISHRIWKMFYLALMSSMILLELFGSFASSVWSFRFHLTKNQGPWWVMDFSTAITIWMWSAAATDILITSVYLFVITRNLAHETGELATRVLHIIFTLSIRSASYTAFFALVTAIVTQVVRQKSMTTELIPYAFWNPLPALYALSLFTTLSIVDKASETNKNWNGLANGKGYHNSNEWNWSKTTKVEVEVELGEESHSERKVKGAEGRSRFDV